MTNTGMDEPQSFAVLLRRYRVAARLTQAELAERAAMSARAITDLERGVRRFPYPDTVDRLARALDLGAADREGLFRARRPRDTGAIGQDVPPNTGPSRAPAQPPNAVSGGEERKLVTVLFGQLVNSSAGVDELDPEDARDLLARYHVRIRADLERFGGTVDKFIGQQLVAFFGAPAAHEDDPERAVRAALAVRDWMLDEATGVRARIGVASGEALVSSGALTSLEAPIAVGEVINVADGLRLAAPARRRARR